MASPRSGAVANPLAEPSMFNEDELMLQTQRCPTLKRSTRRLVVEKLFIHKTEPVTREIS